MGRSPYTVFTPASKASLSLNKMGADFLVSRAVVGLFCLEKKPKMYEDKSNADRCPVNTYLAYKEHRPTSMMTDESPFYLAVNNENPKPGQMWFKCSPLGVTP